MAKAYWAYVWYNNNPVKSNLPHPTLDLKDPLSRRTRPGDMPLKWDWNRESRTLGSMGGLGKSFPHRNSDPFDSTDNASAKALSDWLRDSRKPLIVPNDTPDFIHNGGVVNWDNSLTRGYSIDRKDNGKAHEDQVKSRQTIGARLGRALPGVFTVVIWACATGGAVSVIVTFLALILAHQIVTDGGTRAFTPVHLVLLPFLASLIIWALLLVMQICGQLFGGLLAAAQLLAVINTTVFGLFWKVGEHHASTKVIDQLAGAHATSSHGDVTPHG